MLKLRGITKVYDTGAMRVEALKDIDLAFRSNEFVAILGPSGCGKTTLLNILGGLDRYTTGDLYVNGKSTRRFRDRDWDTYRNHSVGFVFQSYNLIPHQTALANVELALTLSGVSKAERRQRAVAVLTQVGLADQLDKRPNQMSGGQMQRVAIARALINDPDILLADEPTGALDSETSVEVLDILKKVAEDRLVIMVTHNAEFARAYATRIVRLQDGEVVSDSDPYGEAAPVASGEPSTGGAGKGIAQGARGTRDSISASAADTRGAKGQARPSMAFGTALALSFNNLWTKKARTLLTAFAGSIGIVGIALILSLSSGFRDYIARTEEDMLASYPITIEREAVAADMGAFQGGPPRPVDVPDRRDDAIYVNSHMTEMVNMRVGQIRTNDLGAFKAHLDANRKALAADVAAVSYGYDVQFSVYKVDDGEDGEEFTQVHPSPLLDMLGLSGLLQANPGMSAMMAGFDAWEELVDDERFLQTRYELVAGEWPRSATDLLLVVNRDKEIFETVLFGLGLADPMNVAAIVRSRMPGAPGGGQPQLYTMDDLLQLRYRIVAEAEKYAPAKGDVVTPSEVPNDDLSTRGDFRVGSELPAEGDFRIGGDAAEGASAGAEDAKSDGAGANGVTGGAGANGLTGGAGANGLTEGAGANGVVAGEPGIIVPPVDNGIWANMETSRAFMAEVLADAPELRIAGIVRPQDEDEMGGASGFIGYLPGLTEYVIDATWETPVVQAQLARPDTSVLAGPTSPGVSGLRGIGTLGIGDAPDGGRTDAPGGMPAEALNGGGAEALATLGAVDRDEPHSIKLYTKDFNSRSNMTEFISAYNDMQQERGEEDKVVTYTDFIRLILSSVTDIVDGISYVLIAFVAISLVVSSIMIGVIGHISVLERIKEIGILRSLGASKRDIGRVFNAETLIVGFTAGVLGVGLSMLLTIPINIIIESVSGAKNVAFLPPNAALVLIGMSMLLTLVAGILPARSAARQDPVEALRSE